ncbi:Uncharacterised protein [Chlamydia trachomatis]|nr:Uncharacterised protein [Chlamydia trachomatis]
MGVKIGKAIHVETKKMLTNFQADAKEMNRERFLCPSCGVLLEFRKQGKRRLEERVITVSPYFRLAKRVLHKNDCEFDTSGRVKSILRKAIDLKDFIEQKEHGKYAIRLQVVKEALDEKFDPNDEVPNDMDASEKEVENEGEISPYLSTMKKIMILRSELEDNKEIKKEIKLNYKSRTISWNKFYFGSEPEEYTVLVDYLNTASKHPICIEGVIKDYKKRPGRNGDFYVFNLEKPFITEEDDQGVKNVPSISFLIFKDQEYLAEKMIKDFNKGKKQIVAFGEPNLRPSEEKNKICYQNISIILKRYAQVHLFNDFDAE